MAREVYFRLRNRHPPIYFEALLKQATKVAALVMKVTKDLNMV